MLTDPRHLRRGIELYSDIPVILNDIHCSSSSQRLTECTTNGYGVFPNCSYISVALCEGDHEINKILFNSRFYNPPVCLYHSFGMVVNKWSSMSISKTTCVQEYMWSFTFVCCSFIAHNLYSLMHTCFAPATCSVTITVNYTQDMFKVY